MSIKTSLTTSSRAHREHWTVERTLHLGLAGIVILGWTLAYTALMRGVDPPQEAAHSTSAGTKISANLTPQAPREMVSAPAGR
jgi:hypothetical protein